LKPGAVLSTSQTGQDTTLDDVLNTLNDPTGDGLAALVTVLGEGSDGNGANLAAALKALAPAMTDTTALAKILDQQNQLLTSTLDNVGPVASALASDNGKTLTNLTKTANSLLGVTAANEIALKQTLEQLPATLSVARATLSDLAGTANAAAPTLESIRPVTDNLSQITAELQQFSDSLSPALASAAPVLEKAKSLLTEAAPVVSALQTAGPAVVSDAKSLQPIVGDLAGNITNVLNFIKYWALTTNGYDGISHYFRAMLVVTPLSATGLLPGGGNLGVGGTSSPTIATPTGKPSTTSPTPPATTGLRDLLNGVLGGLLSSTTSTDGGVTGMTKTQEQGGLLDLLGLGGN
jgi:phospholipid/cholesterol/gamma-HCH transport system substrate-binding protein